MSIFVLFVYLLVRVSERRLRAERDIGEKSEYMINPARGLFGSARYIHLFFFEALKLILEPSFGSDFVLTGGALLGEGSRGDEEPTARDLSAVSAGKARLPHNTRTRASIPERGLQFQVEGLLSFQHISGPSSTGR